jgi:L-ascorbate metabolism protein UlaG (beta-lactamase superfamily)
MQIIYHGHSFIEIETEQGSILIDPFVTGNQKCDLSLEDIFLKKVTHILLTHGHSDHVGDTIEIAKYFSDCIVVGMVELCSGLKTQWLVNRYWVLSISAGLIEKTIGTVNLFVQIIAIVILMVEYAGLAAGIIVFIDGKKIYHAGDTALFGDMMQFADEKIDVAFLPIGDRYTMGVGDAVIAASRIWAKDDCTYTL